MAERGGKREGAGRKTVADEKKVTELITKAIKGYHNVETDEEAKIKFIETLYEHTRGQIFLAEHLFGKPKETIETTHNLNDFNIKDIFKIGNKSE
jgi:hypothetical protein